MAAETKKRAKTGLQAQVEDLEARLAAALAEKEIDIAKGSGYIDLFVKATDKSMIQFKYPLIAMLSMGLDNEAKVKTAITKIEVASQEIYFPVVKASATSDKKGVSNLPTIMRRSKKLIGKKIKLVLPKAVQRGEATGRKQRYASARIPSTVSLAGFAVLQAWLNSATTDEKSWVKEFFGPTETQSYRVPKHNDADEMKVALLAIAADEEVPLTGTQAQGQGN